MELEIPNLDNPKERKKLVKMLGIFRKLRKISRIRATQLLSRMVHGVKDSHIITGQAIEKDEEKYLLSVFRRSFPTAHRPALSINPKLQWGVRMSYGDEMVELSLNNLSHEIKDKR